jgi:hypothetical protein
MLFGCTWLHEKLIWHMSVFYEQATLSDSKRRIAYSYYKIIINPGAVTRITGSERPDDGQMQLNAEDQEVAAGICRH